MKFKLTICILLVSTVGFSKESCYINSFGIKTCSNLNTSSSVDQKDISSSIDPRDVSSSIHSRDVSSSINQGHEDKQVIDTRIQIDTGVEIETGVEIDIYDNPDK